jgi:hypothetical protein
VARLSGATVELLHLCIHLFLGPAPFVLESGRLLFRPEPVLSKTFFTATEQRVDPFGTEEILPAGSAACALFGSTLLVYRNPTRRDCYGPDAVAPRRFLLYAQDGSTTAVEGACLASREAEALRLGHYRRIDVVLGD